MKIVKTSIWGGLAGLALWGISLFSVEPALAFMPHGLVLVLLGMLLVSTTQLGANGNHRMGSRLYGLNLIVAIVCLIEMIALGAGYIAFTGLVILLVADSCFALGVVAERKTNGRL